MKVNQGGAMSNAGHCKRTYHNRNVIAVSVLLFFIVLIGLLVAYRNYARDGAYLQTVTLSSLHPTYESAESMLLSNDASLVAEAVVEDDGKVVSSPRSGDSSAPPRVSTIYQVKLEKIIKGNVDSKVVTLSLMGGIAEQTNYVMEGVPRLKKGDRVVFFASHGDDGKYYPLSGSTAIALTDSSGNFSLTDATISGERRSFTVQDLGKLAE